MDKKRKLIFFSIITAFISILIVFLQNNNINYLNNSNEKTPQNTKNYQIVEPTITKKVIRLDDKEYEEIIRNFINALCFIDKDPKSLDEFVDTTSKYYMTLMKSKVYIGKTIDGINIESVDIVGDIHNVKVKMTINGVIQTSKFQIKLISGKYIFIG